VAAKADPFSALADPTRRGILELLREEDTLTAGEIAARFPRISRAAVSKHLGVLRRARLVRARERGRERHYHLDPGPLDAIYREWLSRFVPQMEDSLRRLKRRVEEEPSGPPGR
jgi:DNA-binding transcriptional ArsR family regulator